MDAYIGAVALFIIGGIAAATAKDRRVGERIDALMLRLCWLGATFGAGVWTGSVVGNLRDPDIIRWSIELVALFVVAVGTAPLVLWLTDKPGQP